MTAIALYACADVAEPAPEGEPGLARVVPPIPPNPNRPKIPVPERPPNAGRQVVVDDDFESYVVNAEIAGQGDWVVEETLGAPGTGFFARATAPIAGSQSGSLEFRVHQTPGNPGSRISRRNYFENKIVESPAADQTILRNSRCSFVAVIPSTWNNTEVRKGWGLTQFHVFCAGGFYFIEYDPSNVLRVRLGFQQYGPDIVPFDVPVLFELVWDNEAGVVQWFMNGALQWERPGQTPGHAAGESLLQVGGGVWLWYLPPGSPSSQYDVLVDDLHQTLNY
jgi:hypothetical protein